MGHESESQDPLLTSCDQSVVRTIFSPGDLLSGSDTTLLQSVLDNRRAASTLRVYMAAISATHARVDNQTVGSHYLIRQCLKGVQRL